MKITAFDRRNLETIREMLETMLSDMDDKGMDIAAQVGKCNYSPETATFQITFTTSGDDGSVETKEAKDFRKYAYILKEDDLGKKFQSNGHTYEIIGWKPSSRKYPVIGKRSDGKRFKFSVDMVAARLGR